MLKNNFCILYGVEILWLSLRFFDVEWMIIMDGCFFFIC